VTWATKKPFRLVSSTDSSAQYPCALSVERPLARASFMLGVYCKEDSKPPGTPTLGATVERLWEKLSVCHGAAAKREKDSACFLRSRARRRGGGIR
jgi:hypothetical protein